MNYHGTFCRQIHVILSVHISAEVTPKNEYGVYFSIMHHMKVVSRSALLKFVLMMQTHLFGVPGELVIFLEMSSHQCQFHLVFFSVSMSSVCSLAA